MQRTLEKRLRSDEETIKDAGLVLDFDEIARKGSMSREEVLVAKWYGVYRSRQAGDHMARVVVPGGRLTSVEARALARMSTQYSPNRISFTTRQSAQFHCIQLRDLPGFLRDIAKNHMTTFHGCGDVNRNVAACPWASVCKHGVFDVLPYSRETAAYIASCRDLDNLPRKFKITYSACVGGCGQPHINCVGVIAVRVKLPGGGIAEGFQVNIGGGMGWRAFKAQPAFTFVPKEKIHQVCRAAATLFRDHGDRYVRMYARLKFVVHRLGIERCTTIMRENLEKEGVDHGDILSHPLESAADPVPDRPLLDKNPIGKDGLAIQRIMVPKGEIASEALARIADLSEIFGDKHVYSTNRQNLEIHGVQPDRIPELRGEIESLGLQTEHFFGLEDVVSCVGTTYCPLAVTRTHDLFDALQDVVREPQYAPIRDKVLINISGCPNSCAQFRIADIGFRGCRIREGVGSVEGYHVEIGGTESHFSEPLGDFKFDDCVPVVRAVLDTFMASGAEGTLADHVRAAGVGPYQEAAAALGLDYVGAENPLELSVETGSGQTPMDLATIARDVPCQEACPAKTNVPEYIRLIAHGDYEGAHRINQDDNVFPNILGRVCTRPCEDRCRYQWTSTRGPVQICHLKRVAGDHSPAKSQPLAPWFPDTGKQVAVVGGGPAGLAAARELKRYGHAVTIYERASQLGGQVRVIPRFRLPVEEVDEDINAITGSGIEVKCNTDVDAAFLEDLVASHDAVLLGTGTNKPYSLTLDGLEPDLAIEGLHFMKRYNDGQSDGVRGNVVVIGGGFTAVDCARSARRLLGPEVDVSIMYRRGEAQMAANAAELHELREEKVRIETLVTPVSVRCADGKVCGVTFQRNLLGDVDESGKPKFIPIDRSEFEVPCDTLILAIGQTQELDLLGSSYTITHGSHRTSEPKLFAAGDFVSGSGDVISSAADGKAAADEMDAFLMGAPRRKTVLKVEQGALTQRTRDHDLVYPPSMPVLPLEARGGDGEVELGYGEEDGDVHAWRCYLCNHKFEIDQDKCIHCDWCIKVSPRECILRVKTLERDGAGQPLKVVQVPADSPEEATYIWIDSDQCIRCGNCINICPVDAISLRKCDRETVSCNGA